MAISLVTGGAGFIGSHVASHLLKMGHEVVVLDDLSGGFEDNIPATAHFVKGSVTDCVCIRKLFAEFHFDYVYHLAAYAAEGLSHYIKHYNYENNLLGSVNLINESIRHKVKCFVFTSSIAVYGSNQVPMREDQVPVPEDPYGIAKLAVEQELRVSHDIFGLDYIIFRPHNVYGKHQNIGDRYRNVVGIFMNQLMLGRPLTVFGDGKQTRAFSYIDDVAPCIARSVTMPETFNETFNIGGDTEYTVNELAQVVMKAMDMEQPIRHLPPRNEVKHAFSDHSKVRTAFGISPDSYMPLEDGIQRMADWALKTGVRKSEKFRNIEIEENLPDVWLEK